MQRIVKFALEHKTVTVLASLAGVCCSWTFLAGIRGSLAARWDVSHGKLRVLTYGLNASQPTYAKVMDARYGVKILPVAFCIVSPNEIAYADAYDNVSRAAIQERFGANVFEMAQKEAAERLSATTQSTK